MASKFQNRLVGTIIIVALGVIILPGILDGKKKHYKEEFAAIPLVPKPDDQQEPDQVSPVTQPLPTQPPEGASEAIGRAAGENTSQADSGSTAPRSANQPTLVAPPPMQKTPVQQQPAQAQQPQKTVDKPKPQPVEKPKPVEKPQQQTPTKVDKPSESKPSTSEAVPSGQAWVVQLGALKNASKVNEIVAQLRLSGYRAFTVPATPVAGEITRIYVGPDASKAKMQAAIGELKGVSGLSGVVKPWSVR